MGNGWCHCGQHKGVDQMLASNVNGLNQAYGDTTKHTPVQKFDSQRLINNRQSSVSIKIRDPEGIEQVNEKMSTLWSERKSRSSLHHQRLSGLRLERKSHSFSHQVGQEHQSYDEQLQLAPPYDNFQQHIYEGRTQSKKGLNFPKMQHKSVKDFQQQVYERQSTIEFKPCSNQPQLTYTVGASPLSVDDLRLADDNYPRRDIVMIVMMVKNLEHILQSKYQAQGDNICMYLCLSLLYHVKDLFIMFAAIMCYFLFKKSAIE